jgi:hypothetical protein
MAILPIKSVPLGRPLNRDSSGFPVKGEAAMRAGGA